MATAPEMTMSAAEFLEQHPLPWTHHVLLIKDANGRQVIHTGGSYNEFSRMYEGRYLSGLNALIVDAVNARADLLREVREAIMTECVGGYCSTADGSAAKAEVLAALDKLAGKE